MSGTPIVSVTFDHPMLCEVYAPLDKYGNETLSTTAAMKLHKKLASTVPLSHGHVLICQARDDERYMHVLCFAKEDVTKQQIVFSVCLSFSCGW
jgi:hypothetical protein